VVGNDARLYVGASLGFHRRGRASNIISGAWREARRFEYRQSRQARIIPAAQPNNGMHPTADTLLVIYL
jgi:hypothetical protein